MRLAKIAVSDTRMEQKITGHMTIVKRVSVGNLRHRSLAEIVIARKPRFAGKVRRARPQFIVLHGVRVSFPQPVEIVPSARFLALVNG